MPSELARQKAAQAWCTPKTETLEMIPELAEAFAEILDGIWWGACLKHATTTELLEEIGARVRKDSKWTCPINCKL